MEYFLRLQAHDGYQDRFNEITGDRFTKVLCVPHSGRKGENPHYHFCIECDYKKDALRKYLKKVFDKGTGNKHMSLKDWDGGPKACAYLYKEGTHEILRKGFTDDELETFRSINTEVQNKIKKNSPGKIVEDATQHFLGQKPTHQDIFVFIMLRLRANGDWLPNRQQMDRWIMRIQANIFTEKEYKSYLKDLYERWYGTFTYR